MRVWRAFPLSVRHRSVAATNAHDIAVVRANHFDRLDRRGVDFAQDIRCRVLVRVMDDSDDVIVQLDRVRSPNEWRRAALEADVSDDGAVPRVEYRRRRTLHGRWTTGAVWNAPSDEEGEHGGKRNATSHASVTHAGEPTVTVQRITRVRVPGSARCLRRMIQTRYAPTHEWTGTRPKR